MRYFDVAVVGVGGMGSAACLHLAKAGHSVLGLERFSIPNTRGSSHGATRILRLGLHESETYVPIVLRAVELWDEIGASAGQKLFHRVGSLDVSLPEGRIFQGSLRACQSRDIAHEVMDARELRARFPALEPSAEMMGVYQPGSGFLLPEACITSHVNLALAHGAEIHGHERLLDWESKGKAYILKTDRDSYEVSKIVMTTGAWIGKLLGENRAPVTAERCVLGWFAPRSNPWNFLPGRLPVWIVDSPVSGHFYGFPIHGVPGFKLGRLREVSSASVDPDLQRREPGRSDEEDMRVFLNEFFPDAAGPVLSMETCFFENTPDRAPIIDLLPGEEGFWIIGGFSGHGFKYSSAIGELVADLVAGREARFPLAPFRLSRFFAS